MTISMERLFLYFFSFFHYCSYCLAKENEIYTNLSLGHRKLDERRDGVIITIITQYIYLQSCIVEDLNNSLIGLCRQHQY